ncbi:MAG: hypothetical protein JJU32_08310 [Phormidium sp. BM_Day4_Bin.17]|nr:hypothetical protein [Phormidium sp. BM_Day4_Bin.17]
MARDLAIGPLLYDGFAQNVRGLTVLAAYWQGLGLRLGVSLLAIALAACSAVPIFFDTDLVADAISLQLEQTQSQLTSQLGLSESPTWSVDRVKVTENAPVMIQELPGYHLRGTYRLTIELPRGTVTRPKQPFDLYLQGQKEGKTWRLAKYGPRDEAGRDDWTTYLITPEGYYGD